MFWEIVNANQNLWYTYDVDAIKKKQSEHRLTYYMFSGAKKQRTFITFPLEFTWIIAKMSSKHLRKKLYLTEMGRGNNIIPTRN